MPTLYQTEIASPIGALLAVASDKGLCLLEFAEVEERLNRHIKHLETRFQTTPQITTDATSADCLVLTRLKQQLEEYFAGTRKQFDLPLDYHGTAFQQQAWQALCAIPYGETRSYQEQAIAIGKPSAVRAIAGANNRNKLSIVVPCHRVIGKNGSMTGYGGELWRKQFLLELEQAI